MSSSELDPSYLLAVLDTFSLSEQFPFQFPSSAASIEYFCKQLLTSRVQRQHPSSVRAC